MTALDAETGARLQRKLDRANQENRILEALIEEKTRSLYLAQEDLEHSRDYLENVLNSIQSAVIVADRDGVITAVGGTSTTLTGRTAEQLRGTRVSEVFVWGDDETEGTDDDDAAGFPRQAELINDNGPDRPVLVTSSILGDHEAGADQAGDGDGEVFVATDISLRRRLEVELRHAQRMESIGQLAAGVAHEINTPVQFVGDSVSFMGDVITDLLSLVSNYQELAGSLSGDEAHAESLRRIAEAEDEVDLEFVAAEGPKALTRTLAGIDRVTSIVGALRQFSHTNGDGMAPTDLNRVIENTLVVAAGEYKYVADVQTSLNEVPEILADAGDLGQVFINLLVNAAHAIAQHRSSESEMGRISITTEVVDDGVSITMTDTGGGIPEEARERIFEPFFTTKEVGAGTGQGLSLVHKLVVGKHNGTIGFEVEPNVGTTFNIWLPRGVG